MLTRTAIAAALAAFLTPLTNALGPKAAGDALERIRDYPDNLVPAAVLSLGVIDQSGNVILGGQGALERPTFANIQLTASTLTYATTVTVDFDGDRHKTLTLTGNVTLASSNLAAGRTKTLRIVASGGTRNTTFPAGWKFIGAAAPASVASGKTALLKLTSWGTSDANVTAEYVVEA